LMSALTHSARASLDGCAGRGADLSQFKVAIQHKRFNPQKIIRHQCHDVNSSAGLSERPDGLQAASGPGQT
jgi:hypothetical protein